MLAKIVLDEDRWRKSLEMEYRFLSDERDVNRYPYLHILPLGIDHPVKAAPHSRRDRINAVECVFHCGIQR